MIISYGSHIVYQPNWQIIWSDHQARSWIIMYGFELWNNILKEVIRVSWGRFRWGYVYILKHFSYQKFNTLPELIQGKQGIILIGEAKLIVINQNRKGRIIKTIWRFLDLLLMTPRDFMLIYV